MVFGEEEVNRIVKRGCPTDLYISGMCSMESSLKEHQYHRQWHFCLQKLYHHEFLANRSRKDSVARPSSGTANFLSRSQSMGTLH